MSTDFFLNDNIDAPVGADAECEKAEHDLGYRMLERELEGDPDKSDLLEMYKAQAKEESKPDWLFITIGALLALAAACVIVKHFFFRSHD